MYVLGGPPSSSDPHDQSAWEFLGPLRNMDQRQWAIDGTVFDLDGTLYFAYSGWPLDRAPDDYDERTQQLFVARMSDPCTLSSAPTMISSPDEPWERSDDKGINEGPQFLSSPDGNSWRGLAYSCAGSWTKEYKMATLQYLSGCDPLDPSAWKKSAEPLLQNSDERGKGPFGPGHGNFVRVGDETMAVFHATDGAGDGWANRKCRLQRVVFSGVDGGPHMGGCVGEVTRDLGVFSGEGGHSAGGKKEGKKEKLKGMLGSIAKKI